MREPPEPHAEYMFGILAYETWVLYDGKQSIGVVTLNGPDSSVSLEIHPECEVWSALFGNRSFKWWMQWIGKHQYEPL